MKNLITTIFLLSTFNAFSAEYNGYIVKLKSNSKHNRISHYIHVKDRHHLKNIRDNQLPDSIKYIEPNYIYHKFIDQKFQYQWTNGKHGVDDDGNGIIDDIHGANFINNTGKVQDDDKIKGFKEFGYSVCDDIHAQRLWEKVQSFEGGKIVTDAAKSTWGTRVDAPNLAAPCEGPIGEIMFMLDYHLKNEKHLENYKIDVFTPGEVFFEDVGDIPRNAVGKFMQKLNMTLQNNKVLQEIGKDFIAFEDGTRMPCDFAIIIPPYTAPKVLKDSDISDEKGFIPTDKNMRHLDYDNIFSAGDITALAQPKLGHVAIIQAGIAAASLLKDLGEDVEIPPHDLSVFCIMNMGGHEATLIQSDVLYGGKMDIAYYSPISKMMKWGFDNYLYYNKGNMPPDFALKATDKIIKKIL